jgi:hypothetical protein
VPETGTNFTEDIRSPVGCDLFYGFTIEPLDLTGCTSSFVTDFGTFAGTITVVNAGTPDATSTVSLDIPAVTMAAILPGVYAWRNLVTFPTGQILPYGNGSILVSAS